MRKICRKHILRLLWKMVENMFFLDSEHVGMGRMLPQNLLLLWSGRGQKQVQMEQIPSQCPPPQRISLTLSNNLNPKINRKLTASLVPRDTLKSNMRLVMV